MLRLLHVVHFDNHHELHGHIHPIRDDEAVQHQMLDLASAGVLHHVVGSDERMPRQPCAGGTTGQALMALS